MTLELLRRILSPLEMATIAIAVCSALYLVARFLLKAKGIVWVVLTLTAVTWIGMPIAIVDGLISGRGRFQEIKKSIDHMLLLVVLTALAYAFVAAYKGQEKTKPATIRKARGLTVKDALHVWKKVMYQPVENEVITRLEKRYENRALA